jgi:hypothetical protein
VLADIGAAELGFEMQAPFGAEERMIADVVEPEIAVGLGVVGGGSDANERR